MAKHAMPPEHPSPLESTSAALPIVGPLHPRRRRSAEVERLEFIRRLDDGWRPHELPPPATHTRADPIVPLRIEPRSRRFRVDWSTLICTVVTILVFALPTWYLLFGQGESVSDCWARQGNTTTDREQVNVGPWC